MTAATTTASVDSSISVRPPTSSPLVQPSTFTPPSVDWLTGTWHVTHSTLPMWKSKRNVTITYAPHISSPSLPTKLHDTVSYQPFPSSKTKTIVGIDTMSGSDTGAWDWRGKGWLMIASSHWEVLGWGDLAGGDQWAVTYFAKTLFTPAGIDVYSRKKEGLGEKTVEDVKRALGKVEDEGVKGLAAEIFEVKRD